MITKAQLKQGPAPHKELQDGGINSVLTLYKKGHEVECMSAWTISNTAYFNVNLDQFEGWIELEEQ